MPHLAEMVLMLVDLSLYLIFGGGYIALFHAVSVLGGSHELD